MTNDKPTLIGEVLSGCARIEDGRTPDDIILRAAEALGALAAELRLSGGGTADGQPTGNNVPAKAMDLLICVVDHLRAHDPEISDRDLVAAVTTHPKNLDKPFTAIALGWGTRDNTPMRHQQSRVLDCMGDLDMLRHGPEDFHHRERVWRHEIGGSAIRLCLHLIAAERPGITDDELIGMAATRLDAWAAPREPDAAGPEI